MQIMEKLTIINQNGQLVTDSREVAEIVGKEHKNLLRDIKGYADILLSSDLSSATFFVEDKYKDSTGRELPCYLLTKKGCDMVANKMTGKKGVLFTATYVTKFEEMELALKTPILNPMSIEDLVILQAQSVKELKTKVSLIGEKQDKLTERFDNLDKVNITGTQRQQLNATIKKYALDNGITFGESYNEFYSKFNTAFHSNIKLKVYHYKTKNNIKNLTVPDYFERVGQLEDCLRIANKMISGVN